MFLRKALIAVTLAFFSIGINADLIVTLQDDGSGGVMISIKGSGVTGDRGCTDPSSCDNDIEMPDIGDYTDAEETYSLLSPIDFAPGLSITELNVDHDNKPAWPDDLDDLYITLDPFVPPFTAYSVNGTTSLVGASFSSFFPGVYSAQTEYIETGTGFLVILSNETPAGENVVVRPPLEDVNGDPVEDAPDISFTFSDVEEGGETVVVVTEPGAGTSSAPPGFRVTGLGGAPVLFDIETTATLADESFFEICIDFSSMDVAGDPDDVTLVHEVGGAWVDITTDNTGLVICGVADSFSYFAVLESLEIVNTGHAGAWFNVATSGQGQLIDIEPANQFVFLSWFTFTTDDSADPFKQLWFTAQGNYIDYKAELLVYETLGGKFDDSQAVNTEAVGSATLSFADCVYGWLDYTIDTKGLSGSIPLQRAIPGSEGLCQQHQAMTPQAVDINGGMDGAWFDPNTSGQGFLLDVHPAPEGGNFIFVAWFTYGDDTASGQRWLTAQGNFEAATAAIDVYETTGGSFDDPQAVSTGKVGTMTIDFQDCSNALLSYELTDEALSNTIAISRAIPGTQALCEELAAAD